ncbi:hypothetical protein O6937_05285, partial [Chlamydia sp. 04-14]
GGGGVAQRKAFLEGVSKEYQEALSVFENINRDLIQKEKSLDAMNLLSRYEQFHRLLKKQISSHSLLVDLLEQTIADLQSRIVEIKSKETSLLKQQDSTSDKVVIEKLEKELAQLRKEKNASQNELKARLDQLRQEIQDSDSTVIGAKDKLSNQQIQCIINELEERLKNTQLEIENKDIRINELERELQELKHLSELERMNLQDEIQMLREQASDDNYKIMNLTKQNKNLAVLTERIRLLQERLDQIESRRKQEASIYEENLEEIKQLHQEDQNRLKSEHEAFLNEARSKQEEKIKSLEKEKDDLVNKCQYYEVDKQRTKQTLKDLQEEITRLKNTLILYNEVIEYYEKELRYSPVDLERFRKDKVILKAIENSDTNYTRADISCLQARFGEERLDEAYEKIIHLEARVRKLEADLKGYREAEYLHRDIVELNQIQLRMEATFLRIRDNLDPADADEIRNILYKKY